MQLQRKRRWEGNQNGSLKKNQLNTKEDSNGGNDGQKGKKNRKMSEGSPYQLVFPSLHLITLNANRLNSLFQKAILTK